MFTSGLLLAAGSGTRMGADKLLLTYRGRRLIDHAVTALVDCPLVDEVLVVVRPDFRFVTDAPKCRLVVNPDHRQGMGSSLRAGVQAATATADAFVLFLADMPEITSEMVTTLIEAFARSGKRILIPVFEQCHGHPVVFAGDCRAELLRLSGDVGPRAFIAAHPELVAYYSVPYRGVLRDVDTPTDIQ